jgi:hypothetical protein
MKLKKTVIGLACAAMIVSAVPARSGGLEYSITPYLWATGLDGTVGLGDVTGGLDIGFSELLDNLEVAVPIHFEARGPVWTLIAEINYVALGQDLAVLPGTSDIDMLMFEFLSGWQFRPNMELIFGARYVDMSVGLDFELPRLGGDGISLDEGQSWVDPVVGFRYGGQLNRRGTWHSNFRADVAGFGLGSDLTINVRVNVGVDLSYVTSLWFGYHWLDTDYDSNGFRYDVLQQGPEIGLSFKF